MNAPDPRAMFLTLDKKRATKVWIEKTVIVNSYFRDSRAFDLGKALISPSASDSGSDIYRLMRSVKSGDVVLHLVDNKAFVGVSIAIGEYETIRRGSSEWFVVKLERFCSIDPALSRDKFFSGQFAERLRSIANTREFRLFYTTKMTLQQGAYLSEAPDALIEVLEDAYLKASGKSLRAIIASLID